MEVITIPTQMALRTTTVDKDPVPTLLLAGQVTTNKIILPPKYNTIN
jgi:hypothetical protein